MAVKKDRFDAYIKSRENDALTKALPKKKYTHNKVFSVSEENHDNTDNKDTVYSIDTGLIDNWLFSDRTNNDLGDIDGLSDELVKIGQQQPCITREHPEKNGRYELIAGERRWRAAKKAGIDLKVLIKDISDKEAFYIQATENNNRKDLSDFSKGMNYHKAIQDNLTTAKDLSQTLNKSKQYISALLSFPSIPQAIIESIGDMTRISASTGERIKQLSQKGEDYQNAIISLSDKLAQGSLGRTMLDKAVLNIVSKKEHRKITNESLKIKTNDGRHIFTIRKDNNSLPSLHFPKEINDLFTSGKLEMDDFANEIKEALVKKLQKI